MDKKGQDPRLLIMVSNKKNDTGVLWCGCLNTKMMYSEAADLANVCSFYSEWGFW